MSGDSTQPPLTNRRLLWFFAPLAAIGLIQVGGPVAMNGVLLRSDEGVSALAACTLALGLLAPLQAILVFVPQLSMVFGRDAAGRRATLRFTAGGLMMLAGLCWLLVAAPTGPVLLAWIYPVGGAMLADVRLYLLALLPMLVLDGCGRWANGQLLLRGRSALPTTLEGSALGLQIALMAIGLSLSLDPVIVIVAAVIIAGTLGQGGTIAAALRAIREHAVDPDAPAAPAPGVRQQLRFFAPLATTSLCFAAGKSILLVALTRTSSGDPTLEVAVFGLLLSLNLLFNQPVNQTRHLFTAYGHRDLPAVRRFAFLVNAAVVAGAALMVATPLVTWYLAAIQGASGRPLELAVAAAPWVLALPIAAAFRGDAHGRALLAKRTGVVGTAALLRLAFIIAGAAVGVGGQWLDHRSALLVLAVGFAIEAVALWALPGAHRAPATRKDGTTMEVPCAQH